MLWASSKTPDSEASVRPWGGMGWGRYNEISGGEHLSSACCTSSDVPEWKADENTEAQKGDHMPRTCGTGKPFMSQLFLVSLARPAQCLVALCSKDFLGLEVTSSLLNSAFSTCTTSSLQQVDDAYNTLPCLGISTTTTTCASPSLHHPLSCHLGSTGQLLSTCLPNLCSHLCD